MHYKCKHEFQLEISFLISACCYLSRLVGMVCRSDHLMKFIIFFRIKHYQILNARTVFGKRLQYSFLF
uniref:Ovule protein n=1 Tax=Panagrolaimus sp. JU765 TaxID=591449 RepID=A0AC34RKC5_9BILA